MPYYYKLATPKRARVFAQLRSVVGQIASTTNDADLDELNGQIVINFPAMPNEIELIRRANYTNMANTMATPDGFHFYNYTDPLRIPIKFTVHAFDIEYTRNDGPVALLQMAARLHALTLPIIKRSDVTSNLATNQTSIAPATKAGSTGLEGTTKTTFANSVAVIGNDQITYFPAPCRLNILMARRAGTEYGVHCSGFVEEVNVTLRGPWLQGRADDSSLSDGYRNLPSSADFGFTFVHQPGYSNMFQGGNTGGGEGTSLSSSLMLQAMASDVYKRLYNQVDFTKFSSVPAGQDIGVAGINVFGNAGNALTQ